MKIRLFITFVFLYTCSMLRAQVDDWGDWEQIYADKDMTVEVQFYYAGSSCQGGKAFKYKSRFSGKLKQSPMYLNWKFDYLNCDGVMYTQSVAVPIGDYGSGGEYVEISYESLDFTFTGVKFIRHYGYEMASQKKEGSERTVLEKSMTPLEIRGKDSIAYGESAILSVNGALGRSSQWVWYTDSCAGTLLSRGWNLTVTPERTSTYYVRAEGYNDTTACLSRTVFIDTTSHAPTGISGQDKICMGQSSVLSVAGGSLGIDAEWVWYENHCSGGLEIGRGSSIKISPKVQTTYFVRAEGRQLPTACASVQVTVISGSPSIQADSIMILGKRSICEGEHVDLKVAGGVLTKDAQWTWHAQSCDGPSVGNGETIRVSPTDVTTYYVKAEGACYNTNCVSTRIHVIQKAANAFSIANPGPVYKGRKAELKVVPGKSGNNAQWQWYKDQCGRGTPISTKDKLTVKAREQATYYVKATGACNEASHCASVTIRPIRTHHFDSKYPRRSNKFFHYSIAFGLDYQKFSTQVRTKHYNADTLTRTDTTKTSMGGTGFKVELGVHPIIKEYFSWGLFAAFARGNNSKDDDDLTEKYTYNTFMLSSEMALGFKPVKLLLKISENFQSNELTRTKKNSAGNRETVYSYDNSYNTETIGMGLRLGRYAAKNRSRSNVVDIYYNLQRDKKQFDSYDNFLNDWQVGFGIAWWRQSIFKAKFDLLLDQNRGQVATSGLRFSHDQYRFTLLINIDRFY